MSIRWRFSEAILLWFLLPIVLITQAFKTAFSATTQPHYYAHDAIEDQYGVIAPWYNGQNGLVDYRVRIAAEFLKRYPWIGTQSSVMAGPHWIFNARVDLDAAGMISVLTATDQMNGNLGQRFKYITESLPRYYRYTGDPVVIGYMKIAADFMLDYYMTPDDHPWPRFPISVPVNGRPYSRAAPGGWIQLDLAAGIGLGFLRTYQMTHDQKYLDAAKHIGDVFAQKCNRHPGAIPWDRYAQNGESPWGKTSTGNRLTGGVANILIFLDELILLGYSGQSAQIIEARDAGRVYLKEVLLPAWTENDTWERHYWDWEHPVQGILPTGWVVQYMMDHPEDFPDWRTDVRNILSLYFNHAGVSPESNADVYSGAWAYPEGSSCCGRSLDVCPVFMNQYWARYAAITGDSLALEIVRRSTILSFYHFHENGMVEDNIDGGQITAREWSELIGFGPILFGLEILAWLPDLFGPARENHLVRSSSIIDYISYDKGCISYKTFDAPQTTIDVLRLSFIPERIIGDDQALVFKESLDENGYTAQELPCGDWLITIRHDGLKTVTIQGEDPARKTQSTELDYSGSWKRQQNTDDPATRHLVSNVAGAAVVHQFKGNQVRLIGRVSSDGGLADVYLDGMKQVVGIDCWTPGNAQGKQVLFYKNGMLNEHHEIRIVTKGEKNPYASDSNVFIEAIQTSSETAAINAGIAECPSTPQRMIFGYTGRKTVVDSQGHEWLPGTEWIVRSGHGTDPVRLSWWTTPATDEIRNTKDPELYRYGIHAPEFWINATVAPGKYNLRLKFAERRPATDPLRQSMNILVNGEMKSRDLEIGRQSGNMFTAYNLVYNDVAPRNGIIEIRLESNLGEAFIQALEIEPVD